MKDLIEAQKSSLHESFSSKLPSKDTGHGEGFVAWGGAAPAERKKKGHKKWRQPEVGQLVVVVVRPERLRPRPTSALEM